MKKNYMIWWHTKYLDEIDRDTTTIGDILNKANKTFKDLEKLKLLEDAGKIKVKHTGMINPIHIEILDDSIEGEVVNNPLVEPEE